MCQVIVPDSVALGEESVSKKERREREQKRNRFSFWQEYVDIPKEIVKETQQTKSMKKTEPQQ